MHKHFKSIKREISSPRILALYDINKETKISANASEHGLGAVLPVTWTKLAPSGICVTFSF